jgi:hypothetical protein
MSTSKDHRAEGAKFAKTAAGLLANLKDQQDEDEAAVSVQAATASALLAIYHELRFHHGGPDPVEPKPWYMVRTAQYAEKPPPSDTQA